MIRIAITVEAVEAIARSVSLGSVGYENKTDEEGPRLIWLNRSVVDRLRSLRGAGESYSDVILRLASEVSSKGFSGRSRIVANLRIRAPPIGREPRQPDLADQS